jgi:peptide/nickel transport system ATP-binding protein
MIFQNPRTALNPIRPVGRQIADVLARHTDLRGRALRERVLELLARVRIPDPARRADAYPFELSGGMCQRVMIALAVACAPALLIADEPTTGIDVTTQATILDLLGDLAKTSRMAALLITHDLAVVAERCDRIVVMHAGQVLEIATARDLFAEPRHPYTARLVAATPRAGARLADLASIPGSLPDLRQPLPPCRYRARCERAADVCDEPPLPRVLVAPGHLVACRRPL